MTEPATLLFVDDEERILRSLRMLFKPRYQVLTTTDGREALDMVRRERVHVIVSDQRMPIMPGVDLLREVKELSPNTMRILLTGYSDLAAVVGSVNDGEIFRYIHKPWTPAEIQAAVDKAAEIALALMGASVQVDASAVGAVAPRAQLAPGLLVIDDDPTTRDTIKEIGYDHPETGFDYRSCAVFRGSDHGVPNASPSTCCAARSRRPWPWPRPSGT